MDRNRLTSSSRVEHDDGLPRKLFGVAEGVPRGKYPDAGPPQQNSPIGLQGSLCPSSLRRLSCCSLPSRPTRPCCGHAGSTCSIPVRLDELNHLCQIFHAVVALVPHPKLCVDRAGPGIGFAKRRAPYR